jgi:hypothetical protein
LPVPWWVTTRRPPPGRCSDTCVAQLLNTEVGQITSVPPQPGACAATTPAHAPPAASASAAPAAEAVCLAAAWLAAWLAASCRTALAAARLGLGVS